MNAAEIREICVGGAAIALLGGSLVMFYSGRPQQAHARRSDYARAAGGAFVGILVTALVGQALGWGPAELPWIVAPMGASAVLLFIVSMIMVMKPGMFSFGGAKP